MINILIVKEEIRCKDVSTSRCQHDRMTKTLKQTATVEQSIEQHYYALCYAPKARRVRVTHTS